MRYAVLSNNIVENFIEINPEDEFELPNKVIVPAADGTQLGYLYINGALKPPPDEPPPRQMVFKSTVQDRLITKDKMGVAYQLLTSRPNQFAKWFAPNHPAIYCDDPEAVAFVTALGLDPKEILAPE